jgi:5-methylcytosine-specific restriction protein A
MQVVNGKPSALCAECLKTGRPTPATQCDHIKPKSLGGTDDLDNLQALCGPCHDAKTAQERDAEQAKLKAEGKPTIGADGWANIPKRWGYSIPRGVRPSGCKVYIIAGPPASGKRTYVANNAGPRDKVIDLDEIKQRIGGKPWDDDPGVVKRALHYRDMAIRGLADRVGGTAWLIISGKTKAERAEWLEALGPNAELITIDATADECIDRINADPRRKAVAAVTIKVAREWER